jgi:hypothetical protein
MVWTQQIPSLQSHHLFNWGIVTYYGTLSKPFTWKFTMQSYWRLYFTIEWYDYTIGRYVCFERTEAYYFKGYSFKDAGVEALRGLLALDTLNTFNQQFSRFNLRWKKLPIQKECGQLKNPMESVNSQEFKTQCYIVKLQDYRNALKVEKRMQALQNIKKRTLMKARRNWRIKAAGCITRGKEWQTETCSISKTKATDSQNQKTLKWKLWFNYWFRCIFYSMFSFSDLFFRSSWI